MNKYQVFVDVPIDEDWDNIDVKDVIVEADNPEAARELAAEEIETQGHYDYYVWEVSNEDILEDE